MYLIDIETLKKFCLENKIRFHRNDAFSTVDCDNKTYVLVNEKIQDCSLSGRSKTIITDDFVENEIKREIEKEPNRPSNEIRQIRNYIVDKYHDYTHIKGKYDSPDMFYASDSQNVKKLNETEAMDVLSKSNIVSTHWKHEPEGYKKIVIFDGNLDYEKREVFPSDMYRSLVVKDGKIHDLDHKDYNLNLK